MTQHYAKVVYHEEGNEEMYINVINTANNFPLHRPNQVG